MLKVLANLPSEGPLGVQSVEQAAADEQPTRPLADYLRDRFTEDLQSRVNLIIVDSNEKAKEEIGDVEVYIGVLTPELLAAARKLRWNQSIYASQERFLFPELIQSSVTLTNIAGIFSEEIADHVYALILAHTRRIADFVRNQDRRYWEKDAGLKAQALSGKTIGIIGLGGIGAEVARRAPAFGMRAIATRAHPERGKPDFVDEVYGPDGLDHLLSVSDIVVIATPETPKTRALIGEREFGLMKPTAFLINIGRGKIVSLDALVKAIEGGVIAGAGLDVYEIEPLPADHPLWGVEKVVMSPHMASEGEIYKVRRSEIFIENLRRYLDRKPLMNVVDKVEWH